MPSATRQPAEVIKEKETLEYLEQFVKSGKLGLNKFYNAHDLAEAAGVGKKMIETLLKDGCGKEVAKDMALLTLYDIVILIDDSSSMKSEEKGERIHTLKRTLMAITSVYDLANPEGIKSVRFLNNDKGWKNVNGLAAKKILKNHEFWGVTRIGTQLEKKVLERFVWSPKKPMKKPLLVMTITDGAVEGEKENVLTDVIIKCVKKLKDDQKQGGVAFHFSRVGGDTGAAEFLKNLNEHRVVGPYVDCLPMTKFSLDDVSDRKNKWRLLPRLLLGAIVPHWSNKEMGEDEPEPVHIAPPDDCDSDSDYEWKPKEADGDDSDDEEKDEIDVVETVVEGLGEGEELGEEEARQLAELEKSEGAEITGRKERTNGAQGVGGAESQEGLEEIQTGNREIGEFEVVSFDSGEEEGPAGPHHGVADETNPDIDIS